MVMLRCLDVAGAGCLSFSAEPGGYEVEAYGSHSAIINHDPVVDQSMTSFNQCYPSGPASGNETTGGGYAAAV